MSCFVFLRSLSVGLLPPVWGFIPVSQGRWDEGCVYLAVNKVPSTVLELVGTEQCEKYVE